MEPGPLPCTQQLFSSSDTLSAQGAGQGVLGCASHLGVPSSVTDCPQHQGTVPVLGANGLVVSPSISGIQAQYGAFSLTEESCGRISIRPPVCICWMLPSDQPVVPAASTCPRLPGSPVHAPSRHHLWEVQWSP